MGMLEDGSIGQIPAPTPAPAKPPDNPARAAASTYGTAQPPAVASSPPPAPAPAPASSSAAPRYLTRDQLDTYLNANYGELSEAFRTSGQQYGFTSLNDFANAQYVNHGVNEIASGQRSNPFAQAPAPAPAPAPTPAPTPAPAASPAPSPAPVVDYAGLIADAMRAAGVGNQPPATPPPPTAVQAPTVAYTPQTATVNANTDTVAGQMQKLLADGSPVLDRARSLAEQRANSRGLINSSIGAGAGTAAMIDAAAGIGANDAGIYSNQRLANQQAANEMELARGNSATQVGMANAQAQNAFNMAGYNNQLEIGRMGYDSQLGLVRGVFDAGVGEQKDYRTADLQDRNDARSSDRTFMNQSRLNEQSFMNQSRLNEQSFGFDRTLGAETDFRREGIANRAREDEQGFSTRERLGTQAFQSGENTLTRQQARDLQSDNQTFTAGQNELGRQANRDLQGDSQTFTAEQNRLTREATTQAASRGLSGQIATDAARDVAAILADPNIDQENKQALVDRRWDSARTAQQIADGANGTNFADIFPGGRLNPRTETAQTVTPQTQQQIIDQAVNRIVEQRGQVDNRFAGG